MGSPNIYFLQNNKLNPDHTHYCPCQLKQESFTDTISLSDTQPSIKKAMDIYVASEISAVHQVKSFYGERVMVDIKIHYKLIYQSIEKETLHTVSYSAFHKTLLMGVNIKNLTVSSFIDTCNINELTQQSVSIFTVMTIVPTYPDYNRNRTGYCDIHKEPFQDNTKYCYNGQKQLDQGPPKTHGDSYNIDQDVQACLSKVLLNKNEGKPTFTEKNEDTNDHNAYVKDNKVNQFNHRENQFHDSNKVESIKLYSSVYSPIPRKNTRNEFSKSKSKQKKSNQNNTENVFLSNLIKRNHNLKSPKINKQRKDVTIPLSFSDLSNLKLF
ncbi:hypothetical protein [Pontibacillus sp. HMF3514]|uniref:hypothetical protein n=1 Tax=Pontibacillus sp. HMF3514 TaxID=2692425 RepID=UPI00131F6C42|nr:hypothetical protein [Pontibacillus sp. HMF3514]QHE54114.1 hypothetical protein GS400_19730 [Pontibacillus sp. HMF3514]